MCQPAVCGSLSWLLPQMTAISASLSPPCGLQEDTCCSAQFPAHQPPLTLSVSKRNSACGKPLRSQGFCVTAANLAYLKQRHSGRKGLRVDRVYPNKSRAEERHCACPSVAQRPSRLCGSSEPRVFKQAQIKSCFLGPQDSANSEDVNCSRNS